MALCASHPHVYLYTHSYTQEGKVEKETLLPPPEDVQSAPLVCVSLCVRFICNTLSPSPLPLPVCARLGWVVAFVFLLIFFYIIHLCLFTTAATAAFTDVE